MERSVELLQKAIDAHERIVFFGGAGVSTESGIPDFRGEDGIDKTTDERGATPEERRHHKYLVEHPQEYWEGFREARKRPRWLPNATHYKLAEMEKAGKLLAVITQNVDNLHQDAGSENVIELHGNLREAYCESCGTVYPLEKYVEEGYHCECGGMIRPSIVLFGESLDVDSIQNAARAIASADMLIVAGTSLVVFPAARLIDFFQGDCLVLMDKQKTPRDEDADILIREPIAQVFSQIEIR